MLSDVKGMGYNLLPSKDCIITQPFHSATTGRESRPTTSPLCLLPLLVSFTKHTQCFWLRADRIVTANTKGNIDTSVFPNNSRDKYASYFILSSFFSWVSHFLLPIIFLSVMYSIYTFFSFVILCLLSFQKNLNPLWTTHRKYYFSQWSPQFLSLAAQVICICCISWAKHYYWWWYETNIQVTFMAYNKTVSEDGIWLINEINTQLHALI